MADGQGVDPGWEDGARLIPTHTPPPHTMKNKKSPEGPETPSPRGLGRMREELWRRVVGQLYEAMNHTRQIFMGGTAAR